MAERPEPSDRRDGEDRPPEQPDPAARDEAYSEDEEAAVAARLEDLGYI
jgi:hypothetical protein